MLMYVFHLYIAAFKMRVCIQIFDSIGKIICKKGKCMIVAWIKDYEYITVSYMNGMVSPFFHDDTSAYTLSKAYEAYQFDPTCK